jgi:molybdopterin-guanine dinucleotide biosynthesis protein A
LLIARLFELIGRHQAVVPIDGDRIFGTTAIYRTDLGPQIRSLIAHGNLRVMDLAGHLHTRYVELEDLRDRDPHLDSFVNINRRSDYFELLRRFDEPIPTAMLPELES